MRNTLSSKKCYSRTEDTQSEIQEAVDYLDAAMQELSMQLYNLTESVNELKYREIENEDTADEHEETYLDHMLCSIDTRLERLEKKLRFLDCIKDILSVVVPKVKEMNVLSVLDGDLRDKDHRNSEDELPF